MKYYELYLSVILVRMGGGGIHIGRFNFHLLLKFLNYSYCNGYQTSLNLIDLRQNFYDTVFFVEGNRYWTKGTSTSSPVSSLQHSSNTRHLVWEGIFLFETVSTTSDIGFFKRSFRRSEMNWIQISSMLFHLELGFVFCFSIFSTKI